jgi:hypothetical protein
MLDMEAESQPSEAQHDPLATALRLVLGIIIGLAAAGAVWVAYVYAFSPAVIRHPTRTHYHFRLQIIDQGTAVDFGQPKYQTPFNSDICTAALTKEPVHFHDSLDQFVHIHWAGVTGGLLLKNYGWNFIGGPGDTLGYRFDQLPKLLRVPIHGAALPPPPDGGDFYIYTGDQTGNKERNWDDFLRQDLVQFLPAAAGPGNDEAAKLNDVHGSVVIFAQEGKPTDQQVRARFNHLIPLPTSQCSG